MGLRGLRAASRVPTATAGTMTATMKAKLTGPFGPGSRAISSSGTLARPTASVNTPNATAAARAARRPGARLM